MPMVSTIHARLRSATHAVHLELERHLALISPDVSIIRYRRIIALLYGFYRPLEAGLERLNTLAPSRKFPLRARTELLERDLLALGFGVQAISELPTCTDLPGLREAEHFAGCLYVVEGASLGGQVITRTLRERLELTERDGAAFFAGDGASTAARWKCVLQWLEYVSQSGLHVEQIVTSAHETFSSLINWTRAQGLNHEY
jgi:heme oxygenase (biliverdin-IX-beta and delta-forming)